MESLQGHFVHIADLWRRLEVLVTSCLLGNPGSPLS